MNRVQIILVCLVFLVPTSYGNANPKDVRIDGRLDKHCNSVLMLSDLVKKPKLVRTHGANFYTYPSKISNTYTGCQNVWLENGHKLETKYFRYGELTWVRGQEPKDVRPYFCIYKEKRLISNLSFNLKRCRKKIN